jgi:hypothetical protein
LLKTIQREAVLTRGLIQGGKEVKKKKRVRIREHMGLNFGEVGTRSSKLIAV